MTATKVTVLRETKNSLIFTSEDGPRTSAGPNKLRIAKKHVLFGSCELGIPNPDDKKDKRTQEGWLILPAWRATQLCIWKREEDSEAK